ncbi:MAG TPA: hypothetical protein ENN66_06310 [Proteobacteria bacterium]|nr:hypothetical protein [Pseudomonadota bacterium]
MLFNLRRFLYALTQHRPWLGLALLPLAAYLLITAMTADRFTLTRSLNSNPDYPVAVTTSPVDTISLRSLANSPDHFFTDRLAMVSWCRYAETNPGLAKYNFKDKETMLATLAALSLTLDQNNHLQLTYFGPDAELGKQLVDYYMNRLLSRMRAGYHRQPEELKNRSDFALPETIQLDKTNLEKHDHLAWWRRERCRPALMIAVFPLLVVLLMIGFREFLDPSFKSGRQAARYLNLPILGFIPSLDPIISNLKKGEKNQNAV